MNTGQLCITHLIHNEQFMRKVVPYLKEEYFESAGEKELFKMIKTHIAEYNTAPTIEALAIILQDTRLAEKVFDDVAASLGAVSKSYDAATNLDWLVDTTEQWVKDRELYIALMDCISIADGAVKDKTTATIPDIMMNALSVSFDSYLGMDYFNEDQADEQFDWMHNSDSKIPFCIDILNKVTKGGILKKTLNIVMAGINVGKEQRMDSDLLTPTGWKKMRDIKVGDRVMTRKGTSTEVTGVFPQGMKDSYKVTFWDGRSLEVGIEHLWNVYKCSTSSPAVTMSTRDIIDLLDSKRFGSSGTNSLYIDLPQPMEFDEKSFPMDSYLLGSLIGDGSLTQSTTRFSTIDDESISEITPLVEGMGGSVSQIGDTCDYFLKGVVGTVRDLGLFGCRSEDKFIPEEYLWGSADQRLSLLQGLMDTDGTVDVRGCGIEYSTVSEQLANQVQYLIRSLGGASKVSRHESWLDGAQHKDHFRVTIKVRPELNPFRLSRKADRAAVRVKRQDGLAIVSIKKMEDQAEMQCIMVADSEHLYITEDFIVTHNTTFLIDRAAEWVEQGKTVVYFTLEVAEPVIRERTDTRMMDVTFDKLHSFDRTRYKSRIKKLQEKSDGNLIIKEYPAGMAHVGHFRHFINELYIKQRRKVDLIVIDYLGEAQSALLPPSAQTNSNLYYTSVAREFRALGTEFNVPVWTAAQFNRSGQSNMAVDMTDVGDSIGIPKVADFMVAFVQPEELLVKNQAIGIVMKNRYANRGKIRKFVLGIDNDRQRYYDADMNAQQGVMSEEDIAHINSMKSPVPGSGSDRSSWNMAEV